MAEKLKLIIRRIPWSLLLKAVALALLWAFGKASLAAGAVTPFVLFVVIACAAYILPLFRPRAMAVPFFCALVLGFFVPFSALATLAFALIFFLILGIKDLVLVNRETAYETLLF